MSTDSTFKIEARIDHLSDGVGCFDPVQVVSRMRGAFPDLVEDTRDHLWDTCDYFRKLERSDGADGALRIAVRDLQERGPMVAFEIPLPDGQRIKGHAERYWVSVSSKTDFPEDFRRRFVAFLESLTLQPIQVRHGENI